MPAPPEIGEADRGVREPEVVLQMKSKAQSRADRADGVAGEIEKDLAGKCDHARPGIERDERSAVSRRPCPPTRREACRRARLFRKALTSSGAGPRRNGPAAAWAAPRVAAGNHPRARSDRRRAAGKTRPRARNRAASASASRPRDKCRACRRANERCRTRCRSAERDQDAAVGRRSRRGPATHWKFSSRKFPYLKNPSMLRLTATLIDQPDFARLRLLCFPMIRPR